MNNLSYCRHHKVPNSIDQRDKIASIIASHIREEHEVTWREIQHAVSPDIALLKNLYSNGIIKCNLEKSFISNITNKLDYFRKFNESDKRTCDITHALNVEDIYPLIINTQLLCLVSNYLGAPARLQKFTLSWSNRGSDHEPLNPQKFHRDRDDFRTLQLFIYLTDVGNANGPHEYVPKTHNLDILKSMYNVNNISNGSKHSFLSPDELKRVLGSENVKILTLTGSKGSAFLEDTGGFHRGTVPQSFNSSRLMLGITWSLARGTGFVNIGSNR